MKRMSIKVRVTLWYTLFMTVFTVFAILLLLGIGDREVLTGIQSRLENAVSGNLDEVEYDDGGLEIDDDFQIFQDGVYLVLYDEQGNHLYGQLPHGLTASQTPAFQNGSLQKVKIETVNWMFFDVYKPLGGVSGVWLRGVLSRNDAEEGIDMIRRVFMLLLPVFVLLIGGGGYYITYRAFLPVEKMRKTAEDIAEGTDLSRRIQLEEGGDEIHQLADTFDKMLDRIQAAFERERQFTSDVSHELRTPVSVIITQAEYGLRHGKPSENLRESLEIIQKQSRKMSGMISQLLMLARAEQGREKLQKESFDLSEMVETVAEEERERAEKKAITIWTDCESGLYLEGDETMLMRCFINLIENAIAYGREGGNIWIHLSGHENGIQGYVKDDGIGISQEHLPKIWERFYQVDAARAASGEGSSGLGLSMVKWIVEAHGGSITAESHYGRGTTFSFCFKENASEKRKV